MLIFGVFKLLNENVGMIDVSKEKKNWNRIRYISMFKLFKEKIFLCVKCVKWVCVLFFFGLLGMDEVCLFFMVRFVVWFVGLYNYGWKVLNLDECFFFVIFLDFLFFDFWKFGLVLKGDNVCVFLGGVGE